jgi:streptogramin lyase
LSSHKSLSQIFVIALGFLTAIALSGCGVAGTTNEAGPTATTAGLGTIQGSNFGGHAPIVGAHIFVLEATTNGYGAVAKSLLSSSSANASFPTYQDTGGGVTNGLYYVQTDASGAFNITGDYTCDVGQPVYLYAAGGSPSTGGTAPANPAIVNMAMLGVCGTSLNFSSLNFVFMNEVSTVATAYAMAGFAKDSLHIGSSSTNLVGLQNAALNANILYNIQGGGPTSTTPDTDGHIANLVNPNNSNGTVPQQTINSLADIVANCVDSGNTVVGTTPTALQAETAQCRGLFLSTTSNGVTATAAVGGATVPIDTGTALINLAHYPAGINTYPNSGVMDSSNPSTLFGLPSASVPFTPQLSSAPKDWTIALTYKNIPTPSAIAIDAAGDAYIATYSATAGYITELSPQGSLTATSATSVPNLAGLGISTGSTVWAISNSTSLLYKFNSALSTSSSFTMPQSLSPTALVVDKTGNVYVVDNASNYQYTYLAEFNSSGSAIHSTSNYEFSVANGMALAANGSVWVSANNNNYGLYPNPSTGNGNSTVSGGFSNVSGIAVDYLGNSWITGKTTSNQSLVQFTTSGTGTSYGTNTNNNAAIGGLNKPVALSIDGSNTNNSNYFNVWVANSGNNTVSEINSSSKTSALSPSVGYQSGTGLINSPSAIAADNSGNVWVANQGNSTVTEIIGSATPVTTPLAAQAPGVAP